VVVTHPNNHCCERQAPCPTGFLAFQCIDGLSSAGNWIAGSTSDSSESVADTPTTSPGRCCRPGDVQPDRRVERHRLHQLCRWHSQCAQTWARSEGTVELDAPVEGLRVYLVGLRGEQTDAGGRYKYRVTANDLDCVDPEICW